MIIKERMLEEYYNKKTNTLTIPPNFNFNEELKDLPTDVQIVIFDQDNSIEFSKFNRIVNNLPSSVTHLIFADCFNQSVDKLPESITHLTFGYHFNQKVDNLPKNLTHLTLGPNFYQLVDNLP